MSEWRPIETAPKDAGTHLILHGSGDGFYDCTFVGWWDDADDSWHEFGQCATAAPTHWMPLPEPPQ